MNIKKLKKFLNYKIFYFLLILLIISLTYSNVAIAQSTDQQQSADTAEHFSLVLPLDPEGEAAVNVSFQENNLFAFVYGKSNLKVINLDTENIVYEVSYPESSIYHPFLMDDYLIYIIAPGNNGLNYETIKVDLSSGGLENIHFPGSFRQTTDDGYLITSQAYKFQLISLEEGQVLFEPEVSKGGEILCVDDVIIFPFDDSRGNNAGYKAMSTNGEVKFTLEESFNEVRIFLPEYHSKISSFPLPILICNNYNNPSEKQWLLKFINKEGQTIASYSPADLGIEYAYEYLGPTPLRILDENQNNILLQIKYYKQGEPQGYYYILTNLSGNILKIFDENVFDETNAGGFDHQGNILLFQNRDGPLRDILNYYQQDGTLIFGKQIPSVVISRNFKFLSDDEILAWIYNQFEKYSLISGELTGIYPISRDYQIYLDDTIVYNNQVYFFAKSRGGVEPPIPGSNLFSFSTADSGWLGIELVSIKPNAGTTYEVWEDTEVKVKFRTEYGSNLGKNLTVNFEKGEVLAINNNNLEYTWHTPMIVNGNQDTAKITVLYGPVSEEFTITIKDHLPTASFTFNPPSPHTGQNVRFDASLSADLDGKITAYHWNFGDGTEERGQPQNYIDHIFSTAGDYIVNLEVTDNNGQTATISKNIQVTATNYEFSSYLSNFPYSGGNGEFTVSPSYSDCQWTAETDVSWIQINSGCTGPGSKVLIFSVQYNSVEEERVGHIIIEDKIYTITQEPKITLTIPYPQPNGVSIPFLTNCRGACGSGCPDTCVSLPDITIRVADPLSDMSHYLLTYKEVTSCGTHAGCRWHDACFDQCKLLGESSDVGPLHNLCSEKVVERYGPVDGGNWALGDGPYGGYFLFANEPTQDGPFPGDVHSLPEANYRIIVDTGGLMFAGTDANVYITLFGIDGSSSDEILLDNVDTNDFEKESHDLFYVRLKSFEDINQIRLRHDNSFSIPENILIRDLIPENITIGDLINTPIRELIPDNIPLGNLITDNTPLRDLIPDNIPLGELIPDDITINDIIPDNLLAGWFVGKVRIINDDTGQLWHFRANRWLAEDEGDGLIDVMFPLSYKDERDYQIEVYTGDLPGEYGEGTDSNIYITLFGSNGFNTGQIYLSYPYQNNFKTGIKDVFCFIRTANIGELDHFTLYSDNSYIGSDWYCEKIVVKEVSQNADDGEWYIPGIPKPPDWESGTERVWEIPVNNWLTEDNPTRTCYPQ